MTEMEWAPQFESWLNGVKRVLSNQGGQAVAAKVQDLLERVRTGQDEVYVVFCGLFSAGKSSLLNHLAGASTLATGAIPTTSEVAQVVLQDSGGRVVLMDTPGVDSTDESHQAATEGALHQADVVAVVMDYQHVESEANLELARSFSEQGKRLIVIVNQIDKHVDFELSFSEFQARIEQTLGDWGIVYERLFYTSAEHSAYNQVESLAQWLQRLPETASVDRQRNIKATVQGLISEHVDELLADRLHDVENEVLAKTGILPFHPEEAREFHHQRKLARDELQEDIEGAKKEVQQTQQVVREEFVRSVELAQVCPYETTEKGRLYIESLQPGFKMGWWRAGERTKQEQEARLAAFVTDLADRTDKFLVLPLTNTLHQFIQKTSWARPEWQGDVDRVGCEVTPNLCKSLVHQGALISSQYPYQYVKDVVAAIKRQVLSSLTAILDTWFTAALQVKTQELQEKISECQELEDEMTALERWLTLLNERKERIASLEAVSEQGVKA